MKDAIGENKEKVNPKEWTIKEEKIKSKKERKKWQENRDNKKKIR